MGQQRSMGYDSAMGDSLAASDFFVSLLDLMRAGLLNEKLACKAQGRP
jgi:hypothetical protein